MLLGNQFILDCNLDFSLETFAVSYVLVVVLTVKKFLCNRQLFKTLLSRKLTLLFLICCQIGGVVNQKFSLDHQRFRFSENFVADRNFLPVMHLIEFLLCLRKTRCQGGDVVNSLSKKTRKLKFFCFIRWQAMLVHYVL